MKLPTLMPLSVKQNTVRRVVEAIFQGDADTRNGLAEHLQISSMTVGKVVRVLLQAGLVRETVGISQKGRTPRRLIPTNAILYGILYVAPQGFALRFTTPSGQIERRMRMPYNSSLDFEANCICLRRLCEAQRQLLTPHTAYFANGVILHPSFGSREKLCRTVLGADMIAKEDELIGNELLRQELGKTVLYLSVGEKIGVHLYRDGKPMSDQQTEIRGTSAERLRTFTDAVNAMVPIVMPDCVIVEIEKNYALDAESFLNGIRETVYAVSRTTRLFTMEKHHSAERAMRRELDRLVAAQLSAQIGE